MRRKVWVVLIILLISFFIAGCDFSVSITDDYTYEDMLYEYGKTYGTGSSALKGEDKTNKKQTFNLDDEVTIMLYLNGSDLEEDYRSATDDILEILQAQISTNVNVVIQTGGAGKWHINGIDTVGQRFIVRDNKLYKIDADFGSPDMTKADTLSDFIKFAHQNYPAQRNILVLWDHGSGPVEGFGYDVLAENSDTMTLDEMQTALSEGGVYFDFIGFDACIMAGIETAAALCDYADYMVFSQDYEGVMGWEYASWIKEISKNPQISTPELTKIIIDRFVADSKDEGISGILSAVDLHNTKELFLAWENLLYNNYELIAKARPKTEYNTSDRAAARGIFDDILSAIIGADELADYSLVDAAEVAAIAGIDGKRMKDAISAAVIYCSATDEDADMCGLNVVLPFDNEYCYSVMENVYANCGFSQRYIEIIEYMV